MTSRSRTTTGILAMLVLLPVFAGLLACMPEMVPIGNPERARIDPELNGVWVYVEEYENPYIFYFEPYDKRSWLLYGVEVESDDESIVSAESLRSYDGLVSGMDAITEQSQGVVRGSDLSIHKAWLSKVGREHFLVWDVKGALQGDGSWGTKFAYNWRFIRKADNQIELQFMNLGHDRFDEVDHMDRKAVERVIRRHSDEEDFFDEDGIVLRRAEPEDVEAFAEILQDVLGPLE